IEEMYSILQSFLEIVVRNLQTHGTQHTLALFVNSLMYNQTKIHAFKLRHSVTTRRCYSDFEALRGILEHRSTHVNTPP
ncbi:hypothetical protein AGABI1DRAFT_16159, partial [Agaricus bisporus var. burnettii JB137-S8]